MRFTTNAYSREQRRDAWRFALQRCLLELIDAEGEVYGELVTFSSGQQIQFARIAGTRETIALDASQDAPSVWLLMLLEGDAQVTSAGRVLEIAEGNIVYGGGPVRAELRFEGDHRLLVVRVPYALSALQTRTPMPTEVGVLSGDGGTGLLLAGLLRSVADSILTLTDDQARPVELALPEFLANALLDGAPIKALGGAAGGRAAILDRVFQTIEARMSDPNLNIHQIASEHGISARYLQKLFETHGESFGQYLKLRRLERCRLDLASPLHSQRSISEILYQWGFNDSASFSRAFRERYGVSPREYRKAPNILDEPAAAPQRGRPGTTREVRADASRLEELPGDAPPLHREVRHHHLPVSPETIHWGYFSRALKPVLEVRSGDYLTIETLTHHANDDAERMVEGDAGAESVYRWTAAGKAVERRGAGPFDASAFGRGPGEGFGVHICTGPITIEGAMPNDVVEVKILSIVPRASANPRYAGRSFGSNAAAYWGFHYNDLLTEPKQREVITIFEIESGQGRPCAHAVYNYRWTPQVDPSGVLHTRIDYPGIPVDEATITKNFNVLRDVEIPVRPHFGVVALAPAHNDLVDSVPPGNFGGNIDNWRLGPGASVFLPVAVPGGLLSIGDPHASQGDSELCGTAIECSMTAVIQVILHPAKTSPAYIRDLDYPMIETPDAWIVLGFSHPDYLKELGSGAQTDVYKQSSIDLAMRDTFRKARRFLMTIRSLSEDEAIALLSVGVDFGISQVANGNWGVHAVINKALFTS
jgi:acetamidase/formamidase/AraC-like DNA-binding protein